MSIIKAIVSNVVGNMNANGDSFTFLHAEKDWQNLQADEADLPVVYMDMPIKYDPKILAGGGFDRTYHVVLLFLYKSELDNNDEEIDDIMAKAEEAQRDFHLRLEQLTYGEVDIIKSIVAGQCYQVPHLFDTDMSGVAFPVAITPRRFDPSCLT